MIQKLQCNSEKYIFEGDFVDDKIGNFGKLENEHGIYEGELKDFMKYHQFFLFQTRTRDHAVQKRRRLHRLVAK